MDYDLPPSASDLSKKRWWPALRSAYGIPDLVTPENALSYLTVIIGEPADDVTVSIESAGMAAVEILLDLGEEGRLDAFLLGDDPRLKEKCQSVASKWGGFPNLQRDAVKSAIGAIEVVCQKVRIEADLPSKPWVIAS
jgi:hypothetical protein